MTHKGRGFTLIEILVVIAIISLLLAILIPALRQAREQTKRSICGTYLRGIGQGLFLYAQGNGNKFPPSLFTGGQDDPVSNPCASYMVYRINTTLPYNQDKSYIERGPDNLAYLSESDVCLPKMFYCPSMTFIGHRYESYSTWPWNIYDSPRNNRVVRTSYMYFPTGKERETYQGFSLPKYTTDMNKVNARSTLCTDSIHFFKWAPHRTNSGIKGSNSLFGDGHVKFCTNPEAFDPELWLDNPGDHPLNFRQILNLLKP